MKNQKVYLAKSNLASGLDFEYVKSSLLRVPGIEIIEYGQGVEPNDCTCLVYIHDNVNAIQDDASVSINKNVYQSIENFVSQTEDGSAIAGIFIYLGKSHASPRDVEDTTPFMVPAGSLGDNVMDDVISWDNQGRLFIDAEEGMSLLESVSIAMELSSIDQWEKITRHNHPAPMYAMPPIPDISSRLSKGSRRHSANSLQVGKNPIARTELNHLPKQTHFKKMIKPVLIVHREEEEEEEDAPEEEYHNTIIADSLITGRKPRRRR
jgi:uncharacterized protein YuzB (UPF0349 family)